MKKKFSLKKFNKDRKKSLEQSKQGELGLITGEGFKRCIKCRKPMVSSEGSYYCNNPDCEMYMKGFQYM